MPRTVRAALPTVPPWPSVRVARAAIAERTTPEAAQPLPPRCAAWSGPRSSGRTFPHATTAPQAMWSSSCTTSAAFVPRGETTASWRIGSSWPSREWHARGLWAFPTRPSLHGRTSASVLSPTSRTPAGLRPRKEAARARPRALGLPEAMGGGLHHGQGSRPHSPAGRCRWSRSRRPGGASPLAHTTPPDGG